MSLAVVHEALHVWKLAVDHRITLCIMLGAIDTLATTFPPFIDASSVVACREKRLVPIMNWVRKKKEKEKKEKKKKDHTIPASDIVIVSETQNNTPTGRQLRTPGCLRHRSRHAGLKLQRDQRGFCLAGKGPNESRPGIQQY